MKLLNNKVLLEKLEETENKDGDIFLPTSSRINVGLRKGKVLTLPKDFEGGIKEGDLVLYDEMATFGNRPDDAIVDFSNVIVKYNKNEITIFNEGDILVKENILPNEIGGILIPDSAGCAVDLEVVQSNNKDVKVGDIVIVSGMEETALKIKGEKNIIIKASEILAITIKED